MTSFILRIEGVDFTATIADTQNLSAFRGGSLALLNAPERIEAKFPILQARCIFKGASQGAWQFDAPDLAAATKFRDEVQAFLLNFDNSDPQKQPPLKHLSFVVDVAEGSDLMALKRAEAKNRARQFQADNFALPAFDANAKGSSSWDRIRPANVGFIPPEAKGGEQTSASYADRWNYGRTQRQMFYKTRANKAAHLAATWTFVDSLQDMVADPPADINESLRSKVAVFYADGNKFTRIREQGASLDRYKAFSETVVGFQTELLDNIITWLNAGAHSKYDSDGFVVPRGRNKDCLRFETLMWGGDELFFVMPAWLGLEFASKFLEWTKGWTFDGAPLTHGIGLVFCNAKTPIRQAQAVARQLGDSAKEQMGDTPINVLQMEAFESIALPDTGISTYRHKLYGITRDQEDDLTDILTYRNDEVCKFIEKIQTMRKEGTFPRSQIYNFLRNALASGALKPGAKDGGVTDAISQYLSRAGEEGGGKLRDLNILGKDSKGNSKGLAQSVSAIAAFWDYVDPLDYARHTKSGEAA